MRNVKLTSIAALAALGLLAGCGDSGPTKACNPNTKVLSTDRTEDVNGDMSVTVTCTDGKSWEVNDG